MPRDGKYTRCHYCALGKPDLKPPKASIDFSSLLSAFRLGLLFALFSRLLLPFRNARAPRDPRCDAP